MSGSWDAGFDERRYAAILARQRDSQTLRRLYQLSYGADYVEEVEPFGFVTRTDLARIADLLAVGAGHLLADLGCGRGGPGLWMARRTGAGLIGLDIVAEAVEQAEQRKTSFVRAESAAFRVAGFTATGLPDRSLDAAMSVDALWMVADKPAALAEVSRILRPGARFVFTTWEPDYLDYDVLLVAAGLRLIVREETPDWLSRQLRFYEGVLAAARLLHAELGPTAARVLVEEARSTRAVLPGTPRLLFAATRE